jgi:hypothetical protein
MGFDTAFNVIMRGTNALFCYTRKIPIGELPNQPAYIRFIAPFTTSPSGKFIEIPIVQLIIVIIVTVISVAPAIVGGQYVVYIINCFVILFLSTYLAIRFSYVTKENSQVTICDIFVIQTVVYVLFVDYMYNDFLKTFYNKVLLPMYLHPPIKIE